LEPAGTRDHAALALAEVVRACQDGERGYRAACSGAPDAGYQQIFTHYAAERATFAETLEGALREMAVRSPQAGSTPGSLHRGWVSAISILASGHPKAVLRECQRGEDAALRTYRAALRAELPPGIREVVQEQYEAIKKARGEISALVNAAGS
jgi:uncharacterized protein (TIGR02284 family)